jgi:hypothetical protein
MPPGKLSTCSTNRSGSSTFFLGVLWETESLAAQVLVEQGLRPSRVRDEIARSARTAEAEDSEGEIATRKPKIGDIVYYNTKGEGRNQRSLRRWVTLEKGESPSRSSSRGRPQLRCSMPPGPLAQQPEHERWPWPIE